MGTTVEVRRLRDAELSSLSGRFDSFADLAMLLDDDIYREVMEAESKVRHIIKDVADGIMKRYDDAGRAPWRSSQPQSVGSVPGAHHTQSETQSPAV